jgi:Ca2+-binding EF-hand superfamily protein
LYEKYSKLDRNADGLLTYAEFMKLGKDMKVFPTVISSQDYIYIFKTIMKQKTLEEVGKKHDSILDI